jgi:lysophospholipase L1-like esterase
MQALALSAVLAVAAGAPGQDTAPKENTAVKPVARDPGWVKRHEGFVKMVEKHKDAAVVFLGDSITDAWGGEGHSPEAHGAKAFAKEFEPLKTINLGIGGDRTQHVLWRLQNCELPEGFHPKVVMLMIGTNNSNGNDNTAEEIAAGVKAIVEEIQKRSPQTKVLLLGVFPRGPRPNPQRDKIRQVNEVVSKLDDGGKTVKYLDLADKFLEPDRTLSKDVMYDYLHLTPKGYQIWADAVKGPIHELLGPK